MPKLPESVQNVMDHFMKLPGIGPKTAERLVFSLMKKPQNFLESFSLDLSRFKQDMRYCKKCFNIMEKNSKEMCAICSDSRRDHRLVCVVEEATDLLAIEKTGEYKGLYHVLQGVIQTIQGTYPEHLKIKELSERARNENVKEVILALNPDSDGEATTLYIKDKLKDFGVKITILGRGLPMGADLTYADALTLSNALKGRA